MFVQNRLLLFPKVVKQELDFDHEGVGDDEGRHVDDEGVVGSGGAVEGELGGLCRGKSEVLDEVVHDTCHQRHGGLVHVVDDVVESHVQARGGITGESLVTPEDLTEVGTSFTKCRECAGGHHEPRRRRFRVHEVGVVCVRQDEGAGERLIEVFYS